MRLITRVCWVVGSGVAIACAASPPPPAAVSTQTQPAPIKPAEDLDAGPVAPVAAPAELVLVGRIQQPSKFVDSVSTWLNVPVSVQALLEKEAPLLQGMLRYDLPVDLAASLDPESLSSPEPVFAVSLPAVDYHGALDKFRAAGKQIERVSRGQHYVSMARDAHCMVARANGPTSARLICADDRKDLDVLASYMAASLPTETLAPDDAYFELRAEPIRARFGKKAHMMKVGIPIFLREASLGNPRFDAALAEIAHATVGETLALIPDLDRVVMRARLEESPERLRVEAGLVLRATGSWTGQTLLASSKDNAPPPEMFWRLPADAEAASYGVKGSTPERLTPILQALSELAGGALERYDLVSPKFDALLAALPSLAKVTGPNVHAQGPAGNAGGAPRTGLEEVFTLPSYTLSGTEDPNAQFADFVQRAVDAFNEPHWRKRLAEEVDEPAVKDLPKVRQRPAPKAWGLPAGAKVHDLTLSAAWLGKLSSSSVESKDAASKPQPKRPLHVAFVVARHGTQTWVAYGSDEALLAKKLTEVFAGDPLRGLGQQAGLASFGTERALAGGFWSVMTFLEAANRFTDGSAPTREQVLLALPNKAGVPTRMTIRTEEQGPALWFALTLDRAAAEDLAAGFVMAVTSAEAEP